MTESQIENKMVKLVRERGGLCLKFISPNNPGVPDRIVITPAGKVVFVELKTLVGTLSKIQVWQKAELQKRGADVRVLHGWEAVREFVEEAMPECSIHRMDTDSIVLTGSSQIRT